MIKKIGIGATILGIILAGTALGASSFSLTPSSISVDKGETFSSAVSIIPGSEKIYTVKLVLSYPADKIEITGFNLGSGWMPIAETGYDSGDSYPQTSGTLIKTAGWPKGFNTAKTLGTVSFKSKASGSGTVAVTTDSLLLDGQSVNDLTGTATAKISLTVKEPASSPKSTSTVSEKPSEKIVSEKTEEPEIGEKATTTAEVDINSLESETNKEVENKEINKTLLARMGGLFSLKSILFLIFVLIVAAAVGVSVWKKKK